jgi:thiol-disulfide isomerase/thioredoxin
VIDLTIYSRPDCHLCDEMKTIVTRVAKSAPGPTIIRCIDISTDPDLERRYGVEIPVLLINGKKAAKYRIDEVELRRLLKQRALAG